MDDYKGADDADRRDAKPPYRTPRWTYRDYMDKSRPGPMIGDRPSLRYNRPCI
jgi:hypothetical protein